MRKILLLATAIICTLSLSAASYGIKVNGTDYHAGTLNPSPLDPSFTEYSVLSVEIANGSTLQIWDADNNAGWAVDLDGASVKTIVRDGDHYNCTADGCYDFYIKLKWGNDQLYIGNGSCGGGGGDPGTPCQDGPYGLQINGTTVIDAPSYGEPDAQGRAQYKAGCVDLAVGDEIKLINRSCDATWMVDLDPYGSYQNFTGGKSAGKLTCSVAGKYDFYIKLSGEVGDLVYVGPGDGCPDPFDPAKTYYIAGNGTTGSAWCCGEDWSENACKIYLQDHERHLGF